MSARSNTFDGPARRIYQAKFDLENPECEPSTDPWVERLVDILRLRAQYDKKPKGRKLFAQDWGLFDRLLSTYEDNSPGSNKEALEACLIATQESDKIASTLGKSWITPLFVDVYAKFFFDLSNIRDNDLLFCQHIMLPLLQCNTDRLAIGAIWKILACSGSLSLLVEKGFKAAAIRPEDISHLLQLTCMRNCSMLLQYASQGSQMLEDRPNIQAFVLQLTDFDSIRGADRRSDGFAAIHGAARNAYSGMIDAGLHLISLPDDLPEEIFKSDGLFNPEMVQAQEYSKHTVLNGENI